MRLDNEAAHPLVPKKTCEDACVADYNPRGMRGQADLFPQLYDELRRLAHARLAELTPGQTLQPTALVHEVFLRLADRPDAFDGTRHFFFAAARAMHDILVERARQRASLKRGGGRGRLDLDHLVIAHESPDDAMIALSEALADLQRTDPRKHQLVMLRFFAGCTAEEAAAALAISDSTAAREWRFARAWLHQRLSDGTG